MSNDNFNEINRRQKRRSTDMEYSEKKIRFDATINLGHVLTFIGFIATIAGMWQTVDKRIVVLEEARIVQNATDHRQDSELADNKKTVREDLKEINNKLDRLLDRLIEKK